MQVKLNKMRVEHLELQSANKELTEKFDQVKIEAEKAEKQLTNQLSISTGFHSWDKA
jgi:dsDNA-specific endonuclease/ATPase MutS2